MPNPNYQKGVAAERNIIRELRYLGYEAQRSAASHGIFDCYGVRKQDTIFIQSKRGGKPSLSEYKKAVDFEVPEGVIKLVLWFPDGLQAAQVLYYNRLPDWLDSKGTGTAPRVRWFVTNLTKQISMTATVDEMTGEDAFTTRKPPQRRKKVDNTADSSALALDLS